MRRSRFWFKMGHDYNYGGTMALVQQSLRRLQTDCLDLNLHLFLGELGYLEQLRQKHSARQAFERLREAGVIRYIGVTGHSARVLADALNNYPYDCALITLNAARAVMDDREESTAVAGISDLSHLEENVQIASAFEPLSESKMTKIRVLAQC